MWYDCRQQTFCYNNFDAGDFCNLNQFQKLHLIKGQWNTLFPFRNEAEVQYAEQKYNPCCIRPSDHSRPAEQEASEITQLQLHA